MDRQEPGKGAGPGGLPCYRHPERETGIRCARCERPICPQCMVSASVGFQCPDCVGTAPAPARAAAGRALWRAARSAADPRLVTKILIALNAAVFLVQSGRRPADRAFFLLGRAGCPGFDGAAGRRRGQWYRLVTSMFLHGGFAHIGFNMLCLWWIGAPLEAALGRIRYLALYLVSGLAAARCRICCAPERALAGRVRGDLRPVRRHGGADAAA